MYSTCLHCHAALGANEVVEAFPVGRRLAFDADKGRLWVVCAACGRWNLTPLEERWEAVEQCERLYRGVRTRVSTDNIGLARLGEGLELVRIGRPPRPEMAAWRYGRMLNRRYFRAAGRKTLGALYTGVMAGGVLSGAVSLPLLMMIGGFGGPLAWWIHGGVTVERLKDADGRDLVVARRDLREVQLVRDDDAGWALVVPHERGTARLSGDVATTALARLLVHVNGGGASEYVLGRALEQLGDAESPGALLSRTAHRVAEEGHARLLEAQRRNWWGKSEFQVPYPSLLELVPPVRVALEMALHEETERAAVEEDLGPLERAWREAEEIAAIADGLLVPTAVTRRLGELRRMTAD